MATTQLADRTSGSFQFARQAMLLVEVASTVAGQDAATFRRFSKELQKREPFKRIPYNPGRGTRGCVPRVAAAGDPTSELIELLFDLMRHGHAHFGHQLYAPLKSGRAFGVVPLGVWKAHHRQRPPAGRTDHRAPVVHEAVGRKPGHEALRRHPLTRRSRRKRGRGGMGTRCRCELLPQSTPAGPHSRAA
jgi:hypothetical protein